MRVVKFAAAVSLVSLLNLAVLVVIAGLLRHYAAAGPSATENGDVNGDGLLNIADGIYLLTHLFSGGPPPVAIAGPPSPTMAEEIETALSRFFPRTSDYFHARVVSTAVQELLTVPAGKLFVLTGIAVVSPPAPGPVVYRNGVDVATEWTWMYISYIDVTSLDTSRKPILFQEGDVLSTIGTGDIFGYWADAP